MNSRKRRKRRRGKKRGSVHTGQQEVKKRKRRSEEEEVTKRNENHVKRKPGKRGRAKEERMKRWKRWGGLRWWRCESGSDASALHSFSGSILILSTTFNTFSSSISRIDGLLFYFELNKIPFRVLTQNIFIFINSGDLSLYINTGDIDIIDNFRLKMII